MYVALLRPLLDRASSSVHISKRMLTNWKEFRKEPQERFEIWKTYLTVRLKKLSVFGFLKRRRSGDLMAFCE